MTPPNLPTRIWQWMLPIRWPLSWLLWLLGRILLGVSVGLWGIQVGIDFFRLLYLDYKPRPDDVFVVTYPRSGTTWLQMIMYQLTTDGNMDFVHIGDVCPWFERAAINKRNFDAMPSPRVFKSHLPQFCTPRRVPRYIYVAREGKDVAVSFYHFLRSHFRFQGEFSRFFGLFMAGLLPWGSWFHHVGGWWRRRDDPRVLFLKYEDLQHDLEGNLRRICDFCEIERSDEQLREIAERCSFPFMKQHESKFDFGVEHQLELGYTPGTFLRQGKVGGWQAHFNEAQLARFQRRFEKGLARRGLEFEPE